MSEETTNKASGKKTLVEDGTQFKGSLTSKCPIEVNGHVEGDLLAPSLLVSTTGSVHGKVMVGELHSEGRLAGEFDAEMVQLSGSVSDNTVIRAKSLEVKLASANGKMQVIFGECELDIGEGAAKEAAETKTKSARPPAPEEEPQQAKGKKEKGEKGDKGDKGEKARGSIPPTPADANGAGE
jgi:cytoskeletal protein CcmA (bactofilin family)